MDSQTLERLGREELVVKARSLGVERPELLTRVELRDEILRREEPDPERRQRVRGWIGVARDLVAGVIESGLNLPDAAAFVRGEAVETDRHGPQPVATVTLAEIYATQGHIDRARSMLETVLAREPDHPAAVALRERLVRAERPRPAAVAERVASSGPPEGRPPPTMPRPALENEPPAAESEPPVAAGTAQAEAPPPSVLVVRARGRRALVCWERLEALGAPASVARPVLRYTLWRARGLELERVEREIALEEPRGRVLLEDGEEPTVLRAALGFRESERFVPLAIASELALADGELAVTYRPPRFQGGPLTPRELALAHDFVA